MLFLSHNRRLQSNRFFYKPHLPVPNCLSKPQTSRFDLLIRCDPLVGRRGLEPHSAPTFFVERDESVPVPPSLGDSTDDDSDAASAKTDQSDLLAGVSGTLPPGDMSAPPPPVPCLECVSY